MTLKLVCLLAAASLGADASDKKKDADREKIQGTWSMVSAERNGEAPPENFLKNFKLVFSADKVTVRSEGKEREGTFKLDSSKKPKAIDIKLGDHMIQGIYIFEGDKLKICHGTDVGAERPKEFDAKAGSGNAIMLLKREKS